MSSLRTFVSTTLDQSVTRRRVTIVRFGVLLVVILSLVAFIPPSLHALAANNGPALTVNANTSYPINPDIYGACGVSGPDSTFAREIKLPLCRWGGDSTSRYNWQANASNSGVDFWFLGGGSNTSTPGANVDNFIDQNNANGARSLITVPIIPFVEKSNEQVCGFSVKKYGYNNVGGWGTFWFDWNGQGKNGVDANYDCADGVYNDGKSTYFYGNDPHDTSIENTPALQKAWVQHLVQRYGPSSQSRIMYQLDNEPSNWGFLHRDVYQKSSLSYDDLINYSLQYAPVIKQADPSALVIGPSEIQFAWYPDWGGTANMVKYLQAMKQYEQQNNKRILDIFSVHYPDANDNHWPNLTDVDAVRQVVDQNYPGTEIGFDEWNINPDTDPTGGALATADQLGIFARNRVAEAAYWVLDDATQPPAYSFRMYRNYDGQGHQFGNSYLQSSSADAGQLSVYGARRSADGALTVMVINKTGNDLSSQLSLSGINPTGNAQVYTYSNANKTAIVRQADQSVSSSGFTHTYPAYSLSLLVIPANGQVSTPTPTPTPQPGGNLPSPWQSQNIGSVSQNGSATYTNPTFTVSGSGGDIWDTADAFNYAYQPLNGDGTIIAKVNSQQNTDAWAKAGVMIRESLTAGSKHAFMAVTPGNGAVFQRRTATGAVSASTSGATVTAPYWVKLQRSGSTLTGSISSDGTNWTQVGSDTLSMASSVSIGLAVTAHNNSALNTSTFTNVSVTTGGGGGGSSGTLLATDSFSGSAGTLNGQSGGTGWSGPWATQNADTSVPGYTVNTGSAPTYANLNTSGNYAVGGDSYQSTGRSLDVSANGAFKDYLSGGQIGKSGTTLWISALLRKDGNNDQETSLTFHNNSLGWCANCASSSFGVGYYGSASNNGGTRYWSIKIGNTVYRSNVQVTAGQTALLVLKLDVNSSTTLSLYANPTSLGGNAPASASVSQSTTTALAFQSLAYYGGDDTTQSSLDELRVGTSYSAVTPSH